MFIVHLFVSYANGILCHFFSSSWCRGLAAASDCDSSWTFLFTFFQPYISFIVNYKIRNAIEFSYSDDIFFFFFFFFFHLSLKMPLIY